MQKHPPTINHPIPSKHIVYQGLFEYHQCVLLLPNGWQHHQIDENIRIPQCGFVFFPQWKVFGIWKWNCFGKCKILMSNLCRLIWRREHFTGTNSYTTILSWTFDLFKSSGPHGFQLSSCDGFLSFEGRRKHWKICDIHRCCWKWKTFVFFLRGERISIRR